MHITSKLTLKLRTICKIGKTNVNTATCSVLTSLPVSTSHSLAVVSMLAVPTRVLCGLNVTPTYSDITIIISSSSSTSAETMATDLPSYSSMTMPNPRHNSSLALDNVGLDSS